MASSSSTLSRDFFELVKGIGESKSKREEDRLIESEVRMLRSNFAAKDVPPKRMKEYLIRMIYVEMLGHDAAFGHIHAVKMVSSKNLIEKRVSYLAASLTLHKDHEFLFLLVNSLQSDLRSDNFLEVSMALGVVARLINVDIIPAVLPLVLNLLEHKQALIRKKAVVCMQRFFQLDPKVLEPHKDRVRKALCDPDPSVMGATLLLLQELAVASPAEYKDLIPSFVSILKQVTEHRLPREFDYHRIPAPWIQMDILRLLSQLGHADRRMSELMYEVLGDVMKRAAIGTNIGYAIVYECVRTVTTIYPSTQLLEAAAQAISHFLTSDNHNLKYLGVTSLAAIVTIDPAYAVEHQLVVIDCLEDPDETLRRKTLDLLYSMTNGKNVLAIVDRLLKFLSTSTDVFLRTDLVTRLSQLAEKFAPNTDWYLDTMTTIFELGGDLVRPELANNLLRLLATGGQTTKDASLDELGLSQEGSGSSTSMNSTRQRAVDKYIALLQEGKTLPDLMTKTIVWVLGEYGHLSSTARPAEVLSLLISSTNGVYVDQTVRSWILTACQAIIAHMNDNVPNEMLALLMKYKTSLSVDLQQRAHELAELIKNRRAMTAVLPVDAHAQAVVVDPSLAFLNGYVQSALARGAKAYQSPDQVAMSTAEKERQRTENKQSLRFEAYDKPSQSAPVVAPSNEPSQYYTDSGLQLQESASSAPGAAPGGASVQNNEAALKLRSAPRMWGPKGFNTGAQSASAAASAASAPAAAPVAASAQPTPAATAGSEARAPISGAGVPNAAPVAAAAAAKPRVLSEKERSAQSLFAGVGGGVTGHHAPGTSVAKSPSFTRVPAPVAAVSVAPVATPATTQTASNPLSLDMLMGGGALSAASTPAAATGTFDLLSGLAGSSISPSTSAASASTNSSNLPFGLSSALSPNSAPPATNAAATGGFDIMASLGGLSLNGTGSVPPPVSSAPTQTAPVAGAGGLDLLGVSSGAAALGASASISLLASLLAGSNVGVESKVSSVSQTAAVTAQVATFPSSTGYVVYVANQSFSTTLSQANISIMFPMNSVTSAQASLHVQGSSSAINARSNGQGLFVAVADAIPPQSTAALLVRVSAVDSSAPFVKPNIDAQVSVSYQANGQGASTSGVFAIPLPSILRPLPIVTKQYGEIWKQLGSQCEVKVPSQRTAITTPAGVKDALVTVGIHPVDTIKMEIIAAASVLGNSSAAVLCHIRLGEGSYTIQIRSKDASFSSHVSELLKRSL